MHLHSRKTTMREMNQQAKKKNGSKQGENSLGMFVSLMTSSITTTMPNMSKRITSTVVSAVASMLDETPTMMTTFIRQQINLGTHDIMYQLLAKIVKPMVCNKMQQSKELEVRMMHVGENSALLVLRNQEVSNQVINLDSPHLARPIQTGLISLVQLNVAFMPTWQTT